MQTIIAEGFRLSPQQRRLWSLMSRGGGAAYRVQCALLVEGPLDAAALKAALEGVAARHEILRTTFHLLPGLNVPVQVINEGGVEWGPEVELSDAPEHEQRSGVEKIFETMRNAPSASDLGPLVRASLLRPAPGKKILLLDLPALCADAASMNILLGELARAVAAPADFAAPTPAQYADVSEYLSQLLEDGGPGVSYWEAYDLAELAARRPHFGRRPAEPGSFDPQLLSTRLRPDVAARVESAARACGSTPELFLLACWHALLWRVTGWNEVAVGVAFDGRRLEGLDGVPGALVKYLPLDAKPEAGASFARLLAQVGERAAAHAQWQDFFDWGAAAAHDKEAYLPLCYDYAELGARHRVGDVALSLLALNSCSERFDLKLSCVRRDGELFAEFHFDPRQYQARDVECLAEEFAALAENAAAAPETPLAELSMLDAPTRRRLLDEFNRTAEPVPGVTFVHRMIEEQARLNPDAEAVVSGDERLSYAELNARADGLAHHLAARGVGPDVLVGLCFERSAGMLVAMLGVLKAGGAYLPLDPSYPRERLAFMIEDARLKLIITEGRLAERVRPCAADLVLLDEGHEALTGRGNENPAVRDENLAYVIYTSGSTGRPKGVMVTHGGLMNYVSWSRRAYRVAEGRGAPVSSSFAFDLTVTALFPPLAEGRGVHLLGEDAAGESLAEALRGRPGFSLVKLTPAHLKLLALLLAPHELEGATRALVVGGEALDAESLSVWREHAPATRIVNEYGPTETVVGCCAYEVGGGDEPRGPVPIGRPIANTRIYILGGGMGPAPPLAAGEIYVGGAGVARGYLNRPGLTAEKFIPDPFSGEPGARLYKTGDLGRYRADGTIEFLGRADHQVKVRGFRIEPGEIEAALRGHEAVRDCVVVAREGVEGRRLVAYCVVQWRGAREDQLRQFLQERVPSYMAPSFFVFLDEIPLSPNGKVDRRALPEVDAARRERPQVYVAPRDWVESQLCEVWERLLGVSPVGVRDNFFNLGGHSLLALSLIAEVQKRFGRMLPLATLFEQGTVEHLARVVREQLTPASASPLVAIQPGGSRRPVFFIHVGSGNVLCYLDLARHLGDDQPFYGLQDPSLSGAAPPFESIEEMASAYVRHLRAVQPAGPYMLGGWSFGGLVAFEMACQLTAAGQEVALLAVLDSVTPEIERGLDRPRDAATLLAIIAAEMYLPVSPSDLRPLDPEERLRVVAEQMSRAGLVFDDPRGFLRRNLAIFESRVRATLAYRPGPYAGRVSLFVASTPSAGEGFHRGGGPGRLDLTQSWAKLAAGGLDVLQAPGTHHEIAREPNVRVLAGLLRDCIDRASGAGPAPGGAAGAQAHEATQGTTVEG